MQKQHIKIDRGQNIQAASKYKKYQELSLARTLAKYGHENIYIL